MSNGDASAAIAGGAKSESRTQPARSIRHVLVCLDRSRQSELCLRHAQFVADAFDARITLLHVIPSLEDEQH